MRRILIALITAGFAAGFTAGCSANPDGMPDLDTSELTDVPSIAHGPGLTLGKPQEVKVRILSLLGQGRGQVDLVTGEDTRDPAKQKILKADIKPGTMTDYLTFTSDAYLVERGKNHRIVMFTPPPGELPGVRATMMLTPRQESSGYWESKGRLTGHTIGSTPATVVPSTVPAGKALLVLPHVDTDVDHRFLRLSQPGKGCLPLVPQDATAAKPTVVGTFHYVDAGDQELMWTVADDCRFPATATARISLKAGQVAYVLPWFSDQTHLRLVIVPVSADGSGDAGVVVTEPGPTFDPEGGETYGEDPTSTPPASTPVETPPSGN